MSHKKPAKPQYYLIPEDQLLRLLAYELSGNKGLQWTAARNSLRAELRRELLIEDKEENS